MNKLTFRILAAILCMCMLLPMLAACQITEEPTEEPTIAPTEEPTSEPTDEPTAAPTEEPTIAPTEQPTAAPTEEPTQAPTEEPTSGECAHTSTEIISAVDATCTQTGLTQGRRCVLCGEITVEQTETETIPHTPETVKSVKATCTESGLKQGTKCSVCDYVIVEQEIIAPLGHLYGSETSTKCKRCGEVRDTSSLGVYTYYGKLEYISGTGVNFTNKTYDIVSSSLTSGEYPEVSNITTLTNGCLSISGYMLVSGFDIESYVWSYDGKTWYSTVSGTCSTAQATHVNGAISAGLDMDKQGEYRRCRYTNICADLSKYKDQTVKTVWFGARIDGVDTVFPIAKIKNVFVDYAIAPGEDMKGSGSGYKLHSFDLFEIAGERQDYNRSNHSMSFGETVQFNGWIGFDQPIVKFGYVINNGKFMTSPDWMIDAEAGVLEGAGQYAKRFRISVETTVMNNGRHRLYFVVQLQDGTVRVLQTYILTVTGGFEDNNKPDGEVIIAQPDKSAPIDVSSSVSGTTVTTGMGLTYSYLGGSYTGNIFSFSGATVHKVTFMGASRTELAASFNRFKLRYVSSGPIKATLTYTDGSATITDVVYLEAAPAGTTFTCLTKGCLKGNASNLKQIEFVACDGGNANFILCDVDVEMYDIPDSNVKFIQNSRYRLGINLEWGGAISYIEDRKDGMDDLFNLVNQHDTGRLVQQSYYGTKGGDGYVMGDYNGVPWRYNPVQGGDIHNNHSRIIDIVVEEYSIYIKAQPQDWGHDGDITPSYMENIYTIYPDVITVWNRFVDYSNYKHPKSSQELPAFYTVGYLNTFYYCVDGNPWGTPKREANLGFWGKDGRFSTNYFGTDQTWSAFTNADGSFGLGLFTPNSYSVIAGRFGYDNDPTNHGAAAGTAVTGYGPTKDSMSMGCSYIAPVNGLQIKCYQPIEYSYMLTTGSIDQIRSTFKSHQNFTSNSSIEHQGWG